ncbi:Hypothetical predicted protein [Pelobates cultripes]|uniref:Uncharacterized protein n=1 Tax=Pelobates cultripes TaxID=61616 RepID=A0AAD1S518_PELCU|nr:Hypothetical predicted protein [Pelobates cultripes]
MQRIPRCRRALSFIIKRQEESEGNSDRKRPGRPKATAESNNEFQRGSSLCDGGLAARNAARITRVSLSTDKKKRRAVRYAGSVTKNPLLTWQYKKKNCPVYEAPPVDY